MIPPARTAGLVLAGLALAATAAAAEPATPLHLGLADAVDAALTRDERIVVSRVTLDSAQAAAEGARGAYDFRLDADAGWERVTNPVNSSFSGAPGDALAPTLEELSGSASLSRLLPTGATVAVRASAGRETTDGAFALLSPAYSTGVGVELRQPILRGRSIDDARLGIRVAAADLDRAAAELRTDVMDAVTSVDSAYWDLLAARQEVAVLEDSVRLAEEQLSETRIRVDNGAVPETEIAQPRAELERRRGELIGARETLARTQNALRLLILGDAAGPVWSRPIVPVDDPDVQPVELDVASLIDGALAARPELAAAEAARARRAYETEAARDSVRPSLDAVVSYDRFGFAGEANPAAEPLPGLPTAVPPRLAGQWGRSFGVLGDGDFDDARAGVVLSLPLGNRAARAAARIARNAERQADAELSLARKQIRADVLDAVASVETAYQRIEAAQAALDAAEVQLSAEHDRYEAGLSTNFLVLTRQNDLERARRDEIAARTDFRKARTGLARATGSLLDERGIEIDAGALDREPKEFP